ncbi:carbohydrate kinase family protein [Alcaligenes endophyticus]|uniref:Carbohydrate kinase family protein n=1 Tax=Alcaligenes endophyticus TaxID=1929088 RepID=A0ABT8EM14_9BURK|nr:carbohydrate kinase family protein [Alcaligenes endophyticus]MCX5591078.1 carbohydrate kinase family protein [Alcaligenes endophyticus]MDN4122344.1 carbohydrate kinase family protein [Alcaligenes endophyticus]
MSQRILVCGSIAFDTIAVFEGYFKDHILSDNVHALSVSFFVPQLRKEWGGCAGNIAYSLSLLGAKAVPVGMLGQDGHEYLQRMQSLGIDTSMVRLLEDAFTPQCFITNDLDNNQITSFHPGAMLRSAENDLSGQQAAWAIVSPDAKDGMFAHARRLHAQGIPFIFDLGQAMPLFDGKDLEEMLRLCQILTVNEYEAEIIEQRTGRSIADISKGLQAAVVTLGAQGSMLYEQGEARSIATLQPERIADPTGCGDAHRAGLLYGLTNEWPLYDSVCLGNVMGSIKIAQQGPQNHTLERQELAGILKEHYGIQHSL